MKLKKMFLATIVASAILAADGAIAQAAVFVRTAPPASQSSGCSRKIAWPGIRLDGRLLAMGWQRQRIRLDPGQMAAPASGRCGMGWAEVAAWSGRLRLRGGQLALNETRSLGLHSATAWCRRGKRRVSAGPSLDRGRDHAKMTAGLSRRDARALLQIGDNTAPLRHPAKT